jgi:hypothetical protein
MASTSDWDIFDDICGKLKATNAFDNIYRSADPETRGQSSEDRYAAVVKPAGWEQTDESDDETTVQSTRRVSWTLILIVREDDPEARERKLDDLLATSQNALDGECLGGLTICGWTRLKSGRYETATGIEQRMTCSGEFKYWVEGFDENATDD